MPGRTPETPRRTPTAATALDERLRITASDLFNHIDEFAQIVDPWQSDLAPQLGALTIVRFLAPGANQPLTKPERTKLKRMLGLQTKVVRQERAYFRNREFWELANEVAGSEIASAANFAKDFSDLPENWAPAYVSLVGLQNHLKALVYENQE